MVTPACYPSTDVRRFSSRGFTAYPPTYPDRRGSTYPVHREIMERECDNEVTPQRKRIAVACGRCRKRKIRCSGDASGGPCTNCKNAGYEPCQFLRVASQETTMKNEGFTYNLEASRQYQARAPSIAPPLPTIPQYPDNVAIHPSDPLAYRQSSASLGYNSKPYCSGISAWPNAYAEQQQSVGYPMYPPYSSPQEPDYNMNYSFGSGPERKPNPLYLDNDSNYAYSSGPATNALAHRPAPGLDGSNFSFQNVANGSSSSVNGHERVLPTPVGRTMASSGTSSYRNDSTSSTYSKGSQASTTGTSPGSPVSEVPSSYTSYDSSSVSSYQPPSTHLSRPNDLYSTVGSSDSVFPPTEPLRGPGSVPDMTYRYTDTTTSQHRRESMSNARAMALSQGSTTYVPQGASHHAPYMLPGDVGSGSAVENAAADSDRKTAGTLRT
ncbi:hypothetical protein G7046_g3495 [Stylonectria norvegica]|nr:hypothetical protein G7046_g3495 [Stylonectria norvegica]